MRATILLAAVVLTAVAWLRPPEYDEAYSIFLTAGDARPAWPAGVFHAAQVRGLYAGHAGFAAIAADLRRGDVHPPLYFWALELWRDGFGPGWFTARLLCVLCSLATLAVLARLARLAEIPVIPALLITLLAYGFAYTGTVARGFALAQLLDTIGLTLMLAAAQRRGPVAALAGAAGLAFGAASFSNYLAIFTPAAAVFWLLVRRDCIGAVMLLAAGLGLFLPLDFYFFAAQHAARPGQFEAFSATHALARLARDSGAALFGGLPLYAGRFGNTLAAGLAVFAAVCLLKSRVNALFALVAAATPIGLFALRLVFNNTPIEIRYCAFGIPALALILATLPGPLLAPLIGLEALAIIGLACAPATMQPQARAAGEAARLASPGTVTLVPFGNDGVGIPGPFIAAAPDTMAIQLIRQGAPPDLGRAGRVILATIAADDASRAATAQTLAALMASPDWRAGPASALTRVFTRIRDSP
jgi:hypothetical protein